MQTDVPSNEDIFNDKSESFDTGFLLFHYKGICFVFLFDHLVSLLVE